MGAGASIPSSEDEARAAGFSEAEIAAHKERANAEAPAPAAGSDKAGGGDAVVMMSAAPLVRKKDRVAPAENPYSKDNREAAAAADRLRGWPWSKCVGSTGRGPLRCRWIGRWVG